MTVLGCGPVGLATALLLRRAGNTVKCIDTNAKLIAECRVGKFQRLEGLDHEADFAFFDRYERGAVSPTVFFCLSTPFVKDSFALDSTVSAIEALRALEVTDQIQHLVFRSTFSPGTCEEVLLPLLQKEWPQKKISISYFPEFLREKYIKEDLEHPPLAVVAHSDANAREHFERLGLKLDTHASIRMLELLKLSCNAFHALKVSFANEMSHVAEEMGVDAREMMDIFCGDKKLNISERYLQPGAPFGGACLDKDLMALESLCARLDLPLPLLPAIRQSNEFHKGQT